MIQNPYFLGGIIVVISALFLIKKIVNGGVNRHKRELKDKIILITGSNQGIGYETALDLAKNNKECTIILGCRDQKRGEEAMQRIKKDSGSNKIVFMKLDLCDREQIKQFASNFKQKYKNLDVLVNNAGVMMPLTKQMTIDNLELTIGTNHFGHFYLTYLLMECIERTKESRIINVSSEAHSWAQQIDWDNFNAQKYYSPYQIYGYSKLANIFFTQQLTIKYPNIKTVCLHPGVVKTELWRYIANPIVKIFLFPFIFIIGFFFKTVKAGAQTTLACILMPYEQLHQGYYYSDCKVTKLHKNAIDKTQDRLKLWEVSCKEYNIQW